MIAQPSQNTSEEQLLGEIETQIVGLQYHDAAFEPGEAIYLEREPDNVHDGRAVRVENQDFEQIGYLPKKLASWLAPLIDAGKLRVDGYVPETTERPGKNTTPAVLVVFLCEKGLQLLKKTEVRTKQDALHEVVRQAYQDVQDYSDADLVLEFAEGLKPLTCQDVLPETRLLLALMPGVARELRATKSFHAMVGFRELLDKVTVGQAQHYHDLTIFPLSWPESQESPYVLLEEAIESGDAQVSEVDEDGDVPNLSVTNHGNRPILIPEGAILVGAKQNRVVNVTVLVAADSQFTLPVTCVEQGRWKYTSRTFQSEFCAPPSLRSSKLRAVHENRATDGAAESDQGEVWDRVEDCLSSMEVESDTASLTDGMEAAEERLQQYRQAFQLPSDSVGIVVASGEQIIAMDLFDSPQTFESLWGRLGDAYFFDALRRPKRLGKTGRKLAQHFVEGVAASAKSQPSTLGLGDEIEINEDGIVGTGLIYSERVCHMAAFANSFSSGKT